MLLSTNVNSQGPQGSFPKEKQLKELEAWSPYDCNGRKAWFSLSCNYTMQFIDYDSIETR